MKEEAASPFESLVAAPFDPHFFLSDLLYLRELFHTNVENS